MLNFLVKVCNEEERRNRLIVVAPSKLPTAVTSCSRSFPLEYWPIDYPDDVFLAFLSLSRQVPSVSTLF